MARYASLVALSLLFGGWVLSEGRTGLQAVSAEGESVDVGDTLVQPKLTMSSLEAAEARSVTRKMGQLDEARDSSLSRNRPRAPQFYGQFLDPEGGTTVRLGGPKIVGVNLEPDGVPAIARPYPIVVGDDLHPQHIPDATRFRRLEVGVEKQVEDNVTFGQANRVNVGRQLYP